MEQELTQDALKQLFRVVRIMRAKRPKNAVSTFSLGTYASYEEAKARVASANMPEGQFVKIVVVDLID